MTVRGSFRLFAVVVTVVLVATCSSGEETTATPALSGALVGQVTIGPLCPVEPCSNPNNPFLGLEVVLSTQGGEKVTRAALDENGMFRVEAPAGSYLLDVDPCEFLGCVRVVPIEVDIRAVAVGSIEIDIDTGIR